MDLVESGRTCERLRQWLYYSPTPPLRGRKGKFTPALKPIDNQQLAVFDLFSGKQPKNEVLIGVRAILSDLCPE
jgi:hypothetical protein